MRQLRALLGQANRYARAIWGHFRLVAALDNKRSAIWRDGNVIGSSDVPALPLGDAVAAFVEDLYTHVAAIRYVNAAREIVTIAVRSRGSSLSRRTLLKLERIDVN